MAAPVRGRAVRPRFASYDGTAVRAIIQAAIRHFEGEERRELLDQAYAVQWAALTR